MTRRPSVARACRQLERHGSGTPNDVVPEPVTPLAVAFAALQAALPTYAQATENIRLWQEPGHKVAS